MSKKKEDIIIAGMKLKETQYGLMLSVTEVSKKSGFSIAEIEKTINEKIINGARRDSFIRSNFLTLGGYVGIADYDVVMTLKGFIVLMTFMPLNSIIDLIEEMSDIFDNDSEDITPKPKKRRKKFGWFGIRGYLESGRIY